MQRPKRVLVVMNMATAGRSSMAAVLPVLGACGVQGCPLPTAVLSSHLGFGEVSQAPMAKPGLAALERLAWQDMEFDAIYTGYLVSEEEFALAHKAMDLFPGAHRVVDPALGDGGKLYSKTTPAMVTAMQKLAGRAHTITPNLTESALLLGEDPAHATTEAEARKRLDALAGGRTVLITSAPVGSGTGILGKAPGQQAWAIASNTVPQSYPGTGDLFAAATCGLRLAGGDEAPLQTCVAKAARFIETAVLATYVGGGEVKQGVWFEPHLHLLHG